MRKGNKITEFLPTQEARRTSKGNPIKSEHAEEENQSQILQKKYCSQPTWWKRYKYEQVVDIKDILKCNNMSLS